MDDSTTLVALGDVAEAAGVKNTTVAQWLHRGLLPEPVARTSAGLIWSWADIEAWLLATGRMAYVWPEDCESIDQDYTGSALYHRGERVRLSDGRQGCWLRAIEDGQRFVVRLCQTGRLK